MVIASFYRDRHDGKQDKGLGYALKPFATPDKLFIGESPRDMRAGIQRLASIVTAEEMVSSLSEPQCSIQENLRSLLIVGTAGAYYSLRDTLVSRKGYTLTAYVTTLSGKERDSLTEMVTRGKIKPVLIRHANLLLAVGRTEMNCGRATYKKRQGRRRGQGEDFRPDVRYDPPDGHACWTLHLFAQKSIELGYIESISYVMISDVQKELASWITCRL